jgi:hypothetical protein
MRLKLPPWLEDDRPAIERALPKLTLGENADPSSIRA